MRRGLLIYNPAAGSGRQRARLQNLLGLLRDGGIATEAIATHHPGHATTLARDAATVRSVDVVFAHGGDGTIREVAAGLLGSSVALGVIPGGTVNVVRLAFGLPATPEAAAVRLCQLTPRPIDVGLCGGKPFLMQASAGSVAHVLARAQGSWLKKKFGLAGVLAGSGPAFLDYDYPPIEAEIDGQTIRAFSVMVCNISELAGPYRMVPAGRHDDRQLEVALFHGKGFLAEASFSIDLYRGRHATRPDIEIRPVSVVRMLGPHPLPLQIDGDAITAQLPVELRLADERLLVLAEPDQRCPA
ncbi:MAG: hypothetical protein EXS32_04730 [Opitutus sp.]|nr:hypothetical protein [Opitutus sp.]